MVYRLTMRTFMVFEYVHSSGIKLRPARPLTNSILYIYNPIGNEWMHLCKEDIHGHLELLTCFSKGANYEYRLARYRAYTKAFNHVREEGIPLAPIQVDKFTKVLVNGVTLCLIGTFEGKSENDFIKEISGKVYVKAGTDSVDVINLQTRRTKRYKVQYT
jgi:hypothetical protein